MPQEPAPETISQRGRPSFLGNITRLILIINNKKTGGRTAGLECFAPSP